MLVQMRPNTSYRVEIAIVSSASQRRFPERPRKAARDVPKRLTQLGAPGSRRSSAAACPAITHLQSKIASLGQACHLRNDGSLFTRIGRLHRSIDPEWATDLANVQRRHGKHLDQRRDMGHIRFDDEGAAPIIRPVHRSDQPRTVYKPPRRSLQINTKFAPNAAAEEPQRKRRRLVDDRFGSSGDTRRQGKFKDGKPCKAHGRLGDPLVLKQESTIRPAVSVAVAEVVRTRDAGGERVSAKREKKRKRQSDIGRVGGVAGEHAVKGAVGSVPAESVPVDTALSKEKKRIRKRDAAAKEDNGLAKAAANGTTEPSGVTDYAPEATTKTTNRNPKPRKPKKPRTDIKDTALKHSPPADATTEDIDQKPVHDLKVDLATPTPGEVMPQPAAKKQKRKHARHEDQSFAADPCLEGQASAVRNPDSKKRKRHSLTVSTPKTEAEDAPAERTRPGVGDTIDTAGIIKGEQSKPTNQNVPWPAPKVKVEADVQCNNQGQEPEGVHGRVPRSEIDFEKVISEIQWALDDIQRVCSLLPHGYNKRTPPSAWLQEIQWNVRNLGDHFHRHLAQDDDALMRAWNIVCEKYVHGLPRKYYFATGDGWRRQYLRYVKKGEGEEEHRKRADRALRVRSAHAMGLKDHHSQLESFLTSESADKGIQLLRRVPSDAVPAGSQEMTQPGSQRVVLECFVDKSIQGHVPVLDMSEPYVRRPEPETEPRRGGVESKGEGKYLLGSREGVHPDRARDSISPEFQRPGRRRSPGFNLDRHTHTFLPDPVETGPAKGEFTNIEKAAADDVLEYTCKTYDLDSFETRGNMAHWKKLLPELKTEMRHALPNRTADAVRGFCQRRYVPKTEGFWTKEEDEMLLKAHEQHNNRWTAVAGLVGGRTPQQCRDRYWNNLHFGKGFEGGLWARDEETKLISVVSECMEQIKQAIIDKGDLVNEMEELESFLAWNVVSEKMGTQRSNHKVRKKWRQLRRKNPDLLKALKDAHRPALAVTVWHHDGRSDLQKRAAAQYRSFEKGDTYDVLVEIHTAITDHEKIWGDEVAVWTIIGRRSQGSRFSSALMRKAYQEALGIYETKKAVRAATTIAGKAKAMAERMERHRERRGTAFTRVYTPDLRRKKLALSKELVERSGDDVDVALARRQQTLKRRRQRRWRDKARERMLEGENGEEENRAAVENAPARRPRPVRLSKSKKVPLSTEMVGYSDEDENTDTGNNPCPKSGSDRGNADV
ncbi:hypothetical protein LTS02_016109 [Friedmanniomyces endolithicus]|nr:hypothetical protein LTS02_016109 [Friedmanniomyces endolithicus]KAK0978108.1 hypothetical protein LTS01_012844 [Friedmanniomyces endolithicus]